MMNGKLTESVADLAAEMVASNRGEGRDSGPGRPPKKVGLAKSRILGMLVGREAADNDNNNMGDLEYR